MFIDDGARIAKPAVACPQRLSHAEHARIHVVRKRSFSDFRDDALVPLICPTCQASKIKSQVAPATVHGVVFDILVWALLLPGATAAQITVELLRNIAIDVLREAGHACR